MEAAAFLARWSAMPAKTRAAATAFAAAIVLLAVLASVLAHPQRAALFASPLHPDQLSETEERLASWNVPFTPAADNLLVDPRRRNELLLRLSFAGVPHAHVEGSGDVLQRLGALTPQAVIDAQTRDGLAGDIELGLRGIDGVQDARVIIAPAVAAPFADQSGHAASAGVRLRLAPGASLSHDAIAGIRAYVAAAVPGLDARNVTLVDDRGIALSGSGAGDAPDLERSLQSALDTAIGSGNSIVRVRVEYDDRSIASKDVRRMPLSPLPITAATQRERYDGAGKRYDRSAQQIERGSETREVSTSSQAGSIARISAAILIDAARGIDPAQVRALAQAALGLDPRRGDSLAVQAIPFPHPRPAKKDLWWLAYGAIVPLLPFLVAAIALLAALRTLGSPLACIAEAFGKRIAAAEHPRAVRGAAPESVRGVLLNEPAHTAAAIISALPAATAAAVLEMYPEHERAAIVKRMQRPATPLLADAERMLADV